MIAYFLLLVVVALVQVVNTHESIPVSCNSPIYCEGPLLKTVQLARLYDDSKTFVDMVRRLHECRSFNSVLKYFALGKSQRANR
jgi:hypothetical protein